MGKDVKGTTSMEEFVTGLQAVCKCCGQDKKDVIFCTRNLEYTVIVDFT